MTSILVNWKSATRMGLLMEGVILAFRETAAEVPAVWPLKRSFSRGLLVSANYQWAHEIDDGSDGSGDGDSLVVQNVACQSCERADGTWDVRRVFNANAVPLVSAPDLVPGYCHREQRKQNDPR